MELSQVHRLALGVLCDRGERPKDMINGAIGRLFVALSF
jgi:hypothetical protein